MKSMISICFALLFSLQAFVPNMDLCCELSKFPALYAHYEEHVAHEGISLIDFLKLHYGNDERSVAHHHNDEHDEKLPFQGEHQCHHTSVYYCTLEVPFQISDLIFPESIAHSHYNFSLTSEFTESPFQPPKA